MGGSGRRAADPTAGRSTRTRRLRPWPSPGKFAGTRVAAGHRLPAVSMSMDTLPPAPCRPAKARSALGTPRLPAPVPHNASVAVMPQAACDGIRLPRARVKG